MPNTPQFWRTKTLEEMSNEEWESLCDGCGRCCLVKLENEDSGKIHYTNVACTLFDEKTCRCADYQNRQNKVADCVTLTPERVRHLAWLPHTCAYRLLAENKSLFDWHPLISGRAESVIEAGISVRGRLAGYEDDFEAEELIDQIVEWPV
jgi:uncharacterized protein